MPELLDISRFALDDADAAQRALWYADRDPFLSVPCGLLSSAEIHDYVRLTGMLWPFSIECLKSASYEAHIGGECIWWDDAGEKHTKEVIRGAHFVLRANSITFVQVEPTFRLPNYIAVRFNLRITHVHRGLLLGTGPLVDPGFAGKLLIPLHNLTSSDYELDTTEALIWIEFTKTTYGFKPNEIEATWKREEIFKGFPDNKKYMTPDQYLRKANGNHPIQSSIPIAILESARLAASSQQSAVAAESTAKSIQLQITVGGALALGALVIALVALYIQMGSLVQNSNGLATSVQQQISPLALENKQLTVDGRTTADKVQTLDERINRIKGQIDDLGLALDDLKRQVSSPVRAGLEQRIDALQKELDELKRASH
jgi:deoxycytidine triphosphate deaminase/uncharacterized protein YoxC